LSVTAAAGPTTITDAELVFEWPLRPDQPFHGKLYRRAGLFWLWMGDMGWFAVNPAQGHVVVPETANHVRREERLWGIPAALCMLHRGDLPLHAAAVEVDGAALLLAAPGRFGKTTLAAGFHRAGWRMLSEDLSCIRLDPVPSVLPGPAMLRLRPDVLQHFGPLDASPVAQNPDRTSLALRTDQRGDCRPVPLRGIVLLRSAPEGVRVDRVRAAGTIKELWALSFRIPDDASRARCFTAIGAVVTAVPVWNVYRPLHLASLPLTVDTIVSACLDHD
jgi:hypothetical protein